VALGDGLETTFWRTDDGRQRWLSVDLPETAAVRRELLGEDSRRRIWAGSALDDAWMGLVDDAPGVLLLAQGLLMYLRPDDVRALFDRAAARFPAAGFVFDTAPRWFSELSKRGLLRVPQTGYVAPPMPWGMDPIERWRLERRPSIDHLRELHLPAGRGVALGAAYPLLERVPLLGDVTMRVFEARLAAGCGAGRCRRAAVPEGNAASRLAAAQPLSPDFRYAGAIGQRPAALATLRMARRPAGTNAPGSPRGERSPARRARCRRCLAMRDGYDNGGRGERGRVRTREGWRRRSAYAPSVPPFASGADRSAGGRGG
jgi:hypothetical protein